MRRASIVGERSERDVSGVVPGRTAGREAASNARWRVRGLVINPTEGLWGTYVVCLGQSSHADTDEEVEGRMVVGFVEQVCQIEGESRKVVCRVYRRVYLPQ